MKTVLMGCTEGSNKEIFHIKRLKNPNIRLTLLWYRLSTFNRKRSAKRMQTATSGAYYGAPTETPARLVAKYGLCVSCS